jgi:Domain of unknown function (DUF3786)
MAHEDLWSKLSAETPEHVCCRTGMEYDPEREWFILPVLDWTLAIDPTAQQILAIERESCQLQDPPHFALQASAASYLLLAPEAATSLEWISPLELPAAETFFRGPHGLPIEGLQATFGDSAKRFAAAATGLGGVPLDYADASFKFAVFPRLAVAVLLWVADDEFPARARFLVDAAMAKELPLDALLGLIGLLADRLICLDPGPS